MQNEQDLLLVCYYSCSLSGPNYFSDAIKNKRLKFPLYLSTRCNIESFAMYCSKCISLTCCVHSCVNTI